MSVPSCASSSSTGPLCRLLICLSRTEDDDFLSSSSAAAFIASCHCSLVEEEIADEPRDLAIVSCRDCTEGERGDAEATREVTDGLLGGGEGLFTSLSRACDGISECVVSPETRPVGCPST